MYALDVCTIMLACQLDMTCARSWLIMLGLDVYTIMLDHACTRHVHDYACMSVMYTPNLACLHVDVYMNCKPRMMVYKLHEHVLVLRPDFDSNRDTRYKRH